MTSANAAEAVAALPNDEVAVTVTLAPPRARDCAATVILDDPDSLASAWTVVPDAWIMLAPLKVALVTDLPIWSRSDL